jgi:hypothetical protein
MSVVRHVYGINHSAIGRCAPSGLVIYSGNIPHGHDITNTNGIAARNLLYFTVYNFTGGCRIMRLTIYIQLQCSTLRECKCGVISCG